MGVCFLEKIVYVKDSLKILSASSRPVAQFLRCNIKPQAKCGR